VQEDVRAVELAHHLVGVGDEVRRQVAAVELHALDDVELGVQRLGLLDGDHTLVADLLHRLGDHLADLTLAVGRDRADLGHLVGGGDLLGPLLEVGDHRLDGGVLGCALILGADHVAELRLHLCLVGGTGDIGLDRHHHLGVELDPNRVQAEDLDHLVEPDLPAIDRDPGLGDRVGKVAGVDRSVELAALAGLADQHHRQPLQPLGHRLGLATPLQVVRLELAAPGLELLQVLLGGAQRLPLRQQVVAGESGLDPHHFAHLAQLLDPFEENHVHLRFLRDPGLLHDVGQQCQKARPLDRDRKLALLLGRHGGDAARHDLAAL